MLRHRVTIGVLLLLLWSIPVSAIPKRAQSFIDSIGVNVHLMYFDGGYSDLDRTFGTLSYLGVHNVRDATLGTEPIAWARFAKAAEAGIKFNFFAKDADVIAMTARLHNFAAQFPGTIISVEGPNEVNNWPVAYNGKTGTEGAQLYQKALFEAVKSDPLLQRLPVYNFTTYPNAAGMADYGNIHPYPTHGHQPYDTMLFESQHRIMPDKPLVVTEAGYYTLPRSVGWGGVDDQTQAIFLCNFLLDAAYLDLPRTYIYQLLDAYPDQDMTKQENHFGLFDIRYEPKPAANAIRNMVRLMRDEDPAADTFAVHATHYRMQLPSSARSLVFQKATGENIVAIWNEPQIWDETNLRPIKPAVEAVKLILDDGPETISIIDPLKGLAPQKRLRNASQVEFSISGSPIFVILTKG